MSSQKMLFLVGRLVFGGFFLFSAFNHFGSMQMMSGYVASKGVPLPEFAVIGTGVLLLIGALSILFGYLPKVGITALMLFLVPVTLIMHAFWGISDPQARMVEMGSFMRNLALTGAALMFLMIPEPWPVSLGETVRARVPRREVHP